MYLRILTLSVMSIGLYIFVFSRVLERPLTIGVLNLEIREKTLRLESMPHPKLVILAGSNGPYSHSCAVIGVMLNLPRENAGIAVGVGLDDLFWRYGPALHAGDIVYMPMEITQYVTTKQQNDAGPDGAIFLRYDATALTSLPLSRFLGAVFSSSFLDFLESLVEMPVAYLGIVSPSNVISSKYNVDGDRIGASLATADQKILAESSREPPNSSAIASGYGTWLISQFVAKETLLGVQVIGGLPTDFTTTKLPPIVIDTIQSIYEQNGGEFIRLNNLSLYPRADFYDSEDHLAQPCQYEHSIAIAELLGRTLKRPVTHPPPDIIRLAETCPP